MICPFGWVHHCCELQTRCRGAYMNSTVQRVSLAGTGRGSWPAVRGHSTTWLTILASIFEPVIRPCRTMQPGTQDLMSNLGPSNRKLLQILNGEGAEQQGFAALILIGDSIHNGGPLLSVGPEGKVKESSRITGSWGDLDHILLGKRASQRSINCHSHKSHHEPAEGRGKELAIIDPILRRCST